MNTISYKLNYTINCLEPVPARDLGQASHQRGPTIIIIIIVIIITIIIMIYIYIYIYIYILWRLSTARLASPPTPAA